MQIGITPQYIFISQVYPNTQAIDAIKQLHGKFDPTNKCWVVSNTYGNRKVLRMFGADIPWHEGDDGDPPRGEVVEYMWFRNTRFSTLDKKWYRPGGELITDKFLIDILEEEYARQYKST